MSKFRKKPVVIEAVEWTGENLRECLAFIGEPTDGAPDKADFINIPTLEGVMVASRGDFIIRGVKGEVYPCRADIFHLTYEPADTVPTEE